MVERIDIERALDKIASDEAGPRFQSLAVVLANWRGPMSTSPKTVGPPPALRRLSVKCPEDTFHSTAPADILALRLLGYPRTAVACSIA